MDTSKDKEENLVQENIGKVSSVEPLESADVTPESTTTENILEKNIEDDKNIDKTEKDNLISRIEDKTATKDQSNMHYEGDICIYTDPQSKCQYTWDVAKEEWCPRTVDSKNYKFDGNTYSYCDATTGETYIWDVDSNSWKPKIKETNESTNKNSDSEEDEDGVQEKEYTKQDMTKGKYGFENDTHTYTDPSDGTVYLWDREKSAWFPKVDDDFLAQYQMSYGFTDTTPHAQDKNVEKDEKKELKSNETEEHKLDLKRKAPKEPEWFDMGEDCTKVYVSNLPLDLTESEFVDLMQKCGLVMKDLDSGKMKVKLYTEAKTGTFKGDALCTYIKKESVDLALHLLDGYTLKEKRIKVEKARFTMKGDAYDPTLKPKKKRKKDKEKMKKIQEKLFDWRPDKLRHERNKNEKVVIVKNLFDPKIFDKNVGLILEYQQDLHEECIKCGAVRRVIIYDRHPEGVAQINFKEAEAADACVQLLNNRWFGQRQITAETWDGKTKYKVIETEEEANKRLEGWAKFLEEKDSNEKKKSEETVLKEKPKNVVEIEEEEEDEDSDRTRSSAGSRDETDEENDETSNNVEDV